MALQPIQPWNPPTIQGERTQRVGQEPGTIGGKDSPLPLSERFENLLRDVDGSQRHADHLSTDYANGKQNDLHGTMIAIEKADIMFKFAASIRNKALEAYREIMRMGG